MRGRSLYKVLDVAHRFVQIFGHDQRQQRLRHFGSGRSVLEQTPFVRSVSRALAVGKEGWNRFGFEAARLKPFGTALAPMQMHDVLKHAPRGDETRIRNA
jgi:hypothetical protein